jgi:hypothetical protein
LFDVFDMLLKRGNGRVFDREWLGEDKAGRVQGHGSKHSERDLSQHVTPSERHRCNMASLATLHLNHHHLVELRPVPVRYSRFSKMPYASKPLNRRKQLSQDDLVIAQLGGRSRL